MWSRDSELDPVGEGHRPKGHFDGDSKVTN